MNRQREDGVSIIIPVYNEQDIIVSSLTALGEYLDTLPFSTEIIVVNNGSTDSTCEVVRDYSTMNQDVHCYSLPERGPGCAFRKGVEESSYACVLSMDADLSGELRFIEYAWGLLRHADIVVGSKSLGRQRRTLLRLLASHMYIALTQWFFDLSISDYSMGCKAYRVKTIEPVLAGIDGWTGYVLELILHAHRHHAHIVQVSLDCDDARTSKFSLLHEGWYRYTHLFRQWRQLAQRAEKST